jgi:hypothetical protein
MHQDGIARPSRSALQMRAGREALQEVLNALEALSQGRKIALPTLPITDTERLDNSRLDASTALEGLDAIEVLKILFSSGAPADQEKIRELAASLRKFAGP